MKPRTIRVPFGDASYREGALERAAEAFALLRAGHFAGSVYLAGRAVEGMLRALVWKSEPELQTGRKHLETGHDLRRLFLRVRDLGLLPARGRDDAFQTLLQRVARLWFNDLRFASSGYIETHWRRLNEVNKRRSMKLAAQAFFDDCSAIMKRCEQLWRKTG